MIYNQSIQSKDINIKKFLKYSDNYTLIPIKHNNLLTLLCIVSKL